MMNGMKVTKGMWEAICNCKVCDKHIPWEEVETTNLIGGVPLCSSCDKLV